jgi:lipopolysaccharide/colanic/teichoic acid biosynthesis glycosyltransferase
LNLLPSIEFPEGGVSATNSEPMTPRGVLSEAEFHRMVSLERKRTERSQQAFLLILLELKEAGPGSNGNSPAHIVSSVLSRAARETDVVGWYATGLVVGAMFTGLQPDNKSDILKSILARVRRVLQENLSPDQANQLDISFYWFPEEWKETAQRSSTGPVLYPDLGNRNQSRRLFSVVKRAMDVGGSLVALILGAPVFAFIALVIKCTSKGPVFFRQQRVGQYGAPFFLLKFRSMHDNNDCTIHKKYVEQVIAGVAEKNGGDGVYKLTSDPRITKVGAILRRTSLDELPQFINVLKGEMSLVGPRPPLHYEVERYELWHRRRVMEAKPGITGLWQVSGRNRLGFNEMVRLDLMYARMWSPWLDLKILLRTPVAVFEGAH